jgi:hypothetical protein
MSHIELIAMEMSLLRESQIYLTSQTIIESAPITQYGVTNLGDRKVFES